MPESAEEPGFRLDSKTISFIIGLLTLGTAMYAGVGQVQAFQYRMDKFETEQTRTLDVLGDLKDNVSQLNNKLVEFTISINRLDDRYAELNKKLDNERKNN